MGYERDPQMKKIIKKILGRSAHNSPSASLYTLHSYTDESGNFDYEAYRRIQEAGNRAKLSKIWATEENIKFVASALAERISGIDFAICHGTRQGLEQKWFSEALGCEVIGTEISSTAEEFPATIQWDFHEVKDEWVGNVGFVYSNAFDHSYAPDKCLEAWMSCIRPGGYCVLEHSTKHSPEKANELDPFGADLTNMPYLIALWGKGRFYVKEVLFPPKSDLNENRGTAFLLIAND